MELVREEFTGSFLIISSQFGHRHQQHHTEGHWGLVDFQLPAQSVGAAAELQGSQHQVDGDHMVQSSRFQTPCQPAIGGALVKGLV